MYLFDSKRYTDSTYAYFAKKYDVPDTPKAIWEHEMCRSYGANKIHDGLYVDFIPGRYEMIIEEVALTPTNDDMFDEDVLDQLLKPLVKKPPTGGYAITRISKKKDKLYAAERDKKVDGRYFKDGKPVMVKHKTLRRKTDDVIGADEDMFEEDDMKRMNDNIDKAIRILGGNPRESIEEILARQR